MASYLTKFELIHTEMIGLHLNAKYIDFLPVVLDWTINIKLYNVMNISDASVLFCIRGQPYP